MVKILNYEKANKNKTIGYVDILIPIHKPVNLIIRKISHLQSGNKKWFNFPAFPRQEESQPPNYLKYFQFEAENHNTQLLDLLSNKVKEFCELNGIKESQFVDFDNPINSNDSEYLPF